MRFSVASAALAAAFVLAPVAALSQDFSITNQAPPVDPARRDLMRQLQAWWDVHAYYPREASQADVDGAVKIHLEINPDGNIWMAEVEESSGSRSIDNAAFSAFRGGFVQPFPAGPTAPPAEIDLSLHYILTHRHDQKVAAGDTQMASRSNFTITSDAVAPNVVETMLQRTCTGTVVKDGLRNHPMYGSRYAAEAVFFHKPDGTPWVKFWEGGFTVYAPVTETGRLAQWTGRLEHLFSPKENDHRYTSYTVWPDGDNHLIGDIDHPRGTVELTCATEIVPAITSSRWLEVQAPVYPAAPDSLHYRPGYTPLLKNP